jgi:hypothetical protein
VESRRKQRKDLAAMSRRDQFKALFIKSATLQHRDRKTAICQMLTPLFLVLLMFLLQKLIVALIDLDPIDEVPIGVLTPPFHVFTQNDDDKYYLFDPSDHEYSNLVNGSKILYTVDPGINVGYYNASASNETGLLFDYMLPAFGTLFGHKFLQFAQYGHLSNETYRHLSLPLPLNFEQVPDDASLQNVLYDAFGQPPEYAGGYHFKQLDYSQNVFSWSIYYNYSISFGEGKCFFQKKISVSKP